MIATWGKACSLGVSLGASTRTLVLNICHSRLFLNPLIHLMAPSPSNSLEWSINESLNNDSEPELQDVEVQLKIDHAKKVFSAFVGSRESMGRLVHLLFPHITHPQPDVPLLRDTEPLTEPMKSHIGPNVLSQEPKMDRFSLTNHFDLDKLDNTYRNQAKNLIAICQTFVYTQEQALHSYDELRRYRQIISILISLVQLL